MGITVCKISDPHFIVRSQRGLQPGILENPMKAETLVFAVGPVFGMKINPVKATNTNCCCCCFQICNWLHFPRLYSTSFALKWMGSSNIMTMLRVLCNFADSAVLGGRQIAVEGKQCCVQWIQGGTESKAFLCPQFSTTLESWKP